MGQSMGQSAARPAEKIAPGANVLSCLRMSSGCGDHATPEVDLVGLGSGLENDQRQRAVDSADLAARGYDEDLIDDLAWDAISEAYRADSEIYEDGYERSEHLYAAAERKLIAKGYEAVLRHPAVVAILDEDIRTIFDQASMATWVAFNGGGNGEELAIARAHSRILNRETKPPEPRREELTKRRGPRARQPRARVARRRGSRRTATRSAGGAGPGDDSDPDPERQPLDTARTTWDLTATGFGMALGGIFGVKGTLVGGVIAYAWARWRWPNEA